MREIKFRAWHFKNSVMYKYAFPIPDGVAAYLYDDYKQPSYFDEGLVELMQYTGLKDKNGKEIYEGDIVEVKLFPDWVERVSWKGPPDATGEVYWDLAGFTFAIRNRFDKRYIGLEKVCYEESQVIGNIYENPELLED